MAITHRLSMTWSGSGASIPVSPDIQQSDDGEINAEPTIPATTNDREVAAVFTVASLKSVFIISDRDVTLETNSSSAPAQTINLLANKPLYWYSGAYHANPFTVDVTKFYFSNAGAVDANVKIRILRDATP